MSQFCHSNESSKNWSCSPLRKGKWTQADIYLIPFNDRLAVVKDYSPRSFLVKLIAKNILLEKEIDIYKQLDGIFGFPKIYGKFGRYGFILEYKEGKTLSKFWPGQLPDQFFEQLEGVIERMHQQGVVHCDIRRKNVLVSSEYVPWIIDFNTGFCKRRSHIFYHRMFFPLFCRLDRRAFLKLKNSLAPHLLTGEEQAFLEEEIFIHRLGKWIRKGIYRKLKRQWKKKSSHCLPALQSWEKGYVSNPYNVILNLVRGLMLKGYILEKIIKIGISLNIGQGSIIKDEKGLIDFIQACYHQVLGEFEEKSCSDHFCQFLKEEAFCRQEHLHCKWRISFQDYFCPTKDDY